MIPREKAAQLVVDNQIKVKSLNYKEAVQCAKVIVDELEKQEASLLGYESTHYTSEYWQEVKQEIEKL